jgi:zinc protease
LRVKNLHIHALLYPLLIMTAAIMPSQAAAVKTLPNGLRYVILEDHTMPVVSLQVFVRCGAVNEDDATSGVSHFLEHMIFKGTPRLSAGEISKVVETRGGSLNAATGTELTNYYVDMPSEHFAAAFDVLADSVLHPSFPPGEFEKERLVILEEIKRRDDDPSSLMWDVFLETLYTATPYRRVVIGSASSIKAMTREQMVRQHQKYYVPSNMVVVLAGDLPAKESVKKIREHFGSLPPVPPPPLPLLLEPPAGKPDVKIVPRPAKQAHVAVGFTGPALADTRQVAMDVLAAVLGGGQSSRLFQALREQQQKVWNVGASFITHAGSGALGIFAECPPDKVRGLPNDIYLLLYDADSNGFSQAELDRAKAQMKSSWLFSQETYHGQASQWGFYAALGRPALAATYLKELDKVTPRQLQELLHVYFRNRPLSGAAIIPKDGEK